MLLSFELTMPNKGSWNGQWSGQDKKYFVIRNISKRFFDKQEHFKTLKEKNWDSWYYSWNDGWGANIRVEIIDASQARQRRKISAGFWSYEWMVESIIHCGDIKNSEDRKNQITNMSLSVPTLEQTI